MNRLLLLLTFAALVTLGGCGTPTASNPQAKLRVEGRAEAERDLAAGKLRLKTYGLPPRWAWKYHAMARDKLGVEFDAVAGCVVDEELIQRTAGYNELMLDEIDRRHGPGALDKLEEAARAEYQKEKEAKDPVKP